MAPAVPAAARKDPAAAIHRIGLEGTAVDRVLYLELSQRDSRLFYCEIDHGSHRG